MRTLELKDIAGYLPHKLLVFKCKDNSLLYEVSGIQMWDNVIILVDYYIDNKFDTDAFNLSKVIPILRPLSDLYRPITHNGEEIIPIVECAKISFPNINWNFIHKYAYFEMGKSKWGYFEYIEHFRPGFSISFNNGYVENYYQLFDYLHALKIDYRGLIDEGLAVDANKLEINPYK
ncbi:MAG: hypothetical protein LBF69_05965 [Prevotellaceae bacterium]|jgi:hypothetical protein|nr:hypothetical protein [Prevotellaceae bacterium]